ncbi:LysR family transcriptional regulator [Streptomyces indicus]|uniref:DNA-binding transcriptional regulator, LysR family n=1 Tax=Streptomyces indicus TaxID=417292 RepID=A0A1G9BLG3_9ACTN|nr:LysR family transcriptional regulator [Streptomyces indicus]SDK40368.1 DNA-binding transcriptional regulator, LysR family [Streptomyces indicus]
MELRDIEIFLTLAQELHFGRTAEQLRLSPAAVSQSIAKQERRIGAKLFERSSRQVRLTALGRQLRDDVQAIPASLQRSLDRAALTASGKTAMLRVGMIGDNAYDLKPFWDAFRARHPQWELSIRRSSFIDPFAPLRTGDVDVLVAWLPVEEPDLTVGPVICAEPMVAMMAADHPLALDKKVSMEIFGDHGLFGAGVPLPAYWEDAYMPFATPSGRPIERRHTVTACEEVPAIVATSHAIDITSAHVARYGARPDLAYLPIPDARPLRWSLVWHTESETEPVRALARVVREMGPFTE